MLKKKITSGSYLPATLTIKVVKGVWDHITLSLLIRIDLDILNTLD